MGGGGWCKIKMKSSQVNPRARTQQLVVVGHDFAFNVLERSHRRRLAGLHKKCTILALSSLLGPRDDARGNDLLPIRRYDSFAYMNKVKTAVIK